MKSSPLAHALRTVAGPLALVTALAGSGCIQEGPPRLYTGHIIAEVSVGATTHIVFVDEGGGDVGVAEISKVGKASIVMDLFQQERASPLEIFLATADEDAEAPELLVENHRDIASRQAREDPTPRRLARRAGEAESPASAPAAWTNPDNPPGLTACTAVGWEGPTGAWGNPVDSWDNIFANSTSPHSNNVIYPRSKSIFQMPAWNGGSGAYHSHGACISKDTGDGQIRFDVYLDANPNVSVFGLALFQHVGNDDYVIYNDYIGPNKSTTSKITNVGNASATFRHSAAAWVPNPQ